MLYKYKNVNKNCVFYMKEEHTNINKKKVLCKAYNRYCFNNQCLIDYSISVCLDVYKCIKCNKIVKRGEGDNHRCGYEKFKNYKEMTHISSYKCYMLRKNAKGGRCSEGCKKCTIIDTCNLVNRLEKLKENYRKLILRNHPDKGGDKQNFVKIYQSFKEIEEDLKSGLMICEELHEKEYLSPVDIRSRK